MKGKAAGVIPKCRRQGQAPCLYGWREKMRRESSGGEPVNASHAEEALKTAGDKAHADFYGGGRHSRDNS